MIEFVALCVNGGLWCSMTRRITALSFLRSFHMSMISSSLKIRTWLSGSRIRSRWDSGCMISGMPSCISAWISDAIWSLTWSSSMNTATVSQTWRHSASMSPDQLPYQWPWWCRRESMRKKSAIGPNINWSLEVICRRWLQCSPILRMTSEIFAGTIPTSAKSGELLSSTLVGTSTAWRTVRWIAAEHT